MEDTTSSVTKMLEKRMALMEQELTLHLPGRVAVGIDDGALPLNVEIAVFTIIVRGGLIE